MTTVAITSTDWMLQVLADDETAAFSYGLWEMSILYKDGAHLTQLTSAYDSSCYSTLQDEELYKVPLRFQVYGGLNEKLTCAEFMAARGLVVAAAGLSGLAVLLIVGSMFYRRLLWIGWPVLLLMTASHVTGITLWYVGMYRSVPSASNFYGWGFALAAMAVPVLVLALVLSVMAALVPRKAQYSVIQQ